MNFVFGCSRCNCCHFLTGGWLLCVGPYKWNSSVGPWKRPHLEEPCQLRGWYTEGTRVLEPPKNAASLVVCQRFFFQRRTASPPKLPCFTLDSQSVALVASYMATLRHAVWEETFQERYLCEQTSWYLCSCDSCNTFINDEFLHLSNFWVRYGLQVRLYHQPEFQCNLWNPSCNKVERPIHHRDTIQVL